MSETNLNSSPPFLQKISQLFSKIEENISAIFMAACVLFMCWEVMARYFFNLPVYVTNEWSPYLNTWAMLFGNAILIRTRGHIAISMLQEALKKDSDRRWLDLYTDLVGLAFCVIFTWAGYLTVANTKALHTVSESMAHTPMWIPYSMMLVTGVIMVFHTVKNLVQDVRMLLNCEKPFRSLMLPVLVVITVAVVIFVNNCSSALVMMAVLLVVMLALGVPITYALGLSTIIAIANFKIIGMQGLANKMWTNINKYSLLAIPLFIVSGNIMAKGNLGKRLLDVAAALLKKFHGGYGIAILAAAIYFGAISGAAAAAAAALGVMGLPLLVERGYPKKFGAGLIGAGGTLASIIPPSSILILYAATAEVSVTNMFTAGIVPGVTVGLILILYVWFMARKNHWDETAEPFSWKEVGRATKDAIWALIMPVAILGVIYAGVCTATEAAAVSVIYAALVCRFIYKDITWKDLAQIFVDSVKTSAFIFAITMTASLFSFLITMERLPQMILSLVMNINMGKVLFLILFNLILFALGFFMTPGPIILIVIPVILPVAESLGLNPIHIGIMATLNMQLALITPPVGTNIYVMSSVGKMSVQDSIRGLMPFVVILLIALVVISAVPWFSLCLIH